MFPQIGLAFLLALVKIQSSEGYITNEIIPDKELIFAIVVNRHGDRSPDEDELSLSDQQDKIKNVTYIEGLEGLTIEGKRRAYQLGKFYRLRYGSHDLKLISNIYFRDEIAIRSTDKERTKMTVQVAMAATYPPEPEQQWDEGIGKVWQPVPYTAVPLTQDYLRFYSNCERFMSMMEEEKCAALAEEFQPFMDLIPLLKQKTGRNFTENPLLFQTLYDLLKSTLSLGLDIPAWSKPILPKLSEAARLAYLLYYKNHEMKKLGGGVLLNNFLDAADDLMLGKPVSQRLRVFSAHDFNVGALMMVSKVMSEHPIPEYGAAFALELYRQKNGQYTVLSVYLPVAGNSSPQELRIAGCGQDPYCEYSKFRELVKEFRLSEAEFNKICYPPKC